MRKQQSVSEAPGERRARVAAKAGHSEAHERLVISRVLERRASVPERSRDPSEPDGVARDVPPLISKRRLSPLLREIAGIPDAKPNGLPHSG
jgi:hypothetical protein